MIPLFGLDFAFWKDQDQDGDGDGDGLDGGLRFCVYTESDEWRESVRI
jgi:hypothetical protein